jgi:hypothetical protein
MSLRKFFAEAGTVGNDWEFALSCKLLRPPPVAEIFICNNEHGDPDEGSYRPRISVLN